MIKSLLVASITFGVWIKPKAQLDYNLLYSIHVERNQSLDPSMKSITSSPTSIMILSPLGTGLAAWIKKDQELFEKATMQCLAIATNVILTLSIKELVARQRPFETYSEFTPLTAAGSRSFPSGHTSSSFNIATSLSLSFPKWYVIAPSFLWASAVGYSRMHLGVHYPSDVLVGAVLGSGCALGSYYLNAWLWSKKKKAQKV